MAKKKANEEADKGDGGEKVYFISLVASNNRGEPIKKQHLYDLISEEYDLKDTSGDAISPIFTDVSKLVEYYEAYQKKPISSTTTVYDLVKCFIENNPKAHYVLDELPILANRSK